MAKRIGWATNSDSSPIFTVQQSQFTTVHECLDANKLLHQVKESKVLTTKVTTTLHGH